MSLKERADALTASNAEGGLAEAVAQLILPRVG